MNSHQESPLNRRRFLKRAAGAATGLVAAPLFIPSTALGRDGSTPANERLTLGVIGLGGRGTSVMNAFLGRPEVQVRAVCEVQRGRREAGKRTVDQRYGNTDCATHIDLREILARSDIDAVLIATGDNWHSTAAILAARAGKDMYCEKPMSVSIAESRAVSDTMRRYGRVFQCGTQRRSVGNFVFAVQLARRGDLGEIREVYAERAPWFEEIHRRWLAPEPQPAREDLAWDLWLGPAAWRPFNREYVGRGFWSGHLDFSGGSVTEWGSHTVDLCQWAIDADDTSAVEYEMEGQTPVARYANGIKLVMGPPNLNIGSCAVRFEGTEGWVQTGDSGRVEASSKSLLDQRRFDPGPPTDHIGNFLECVRTRRQTIADAEGAHRSISTCHAANVSKLLGRPVRWNPEREEFVGDPQANRLRARPIREPWTV